MSGGFLPGIKRVGRNWIHLALFSPSHLRSCFCKQNKLTSLPFLNTLPALFWSDPLYIKIAWFSLLRTVCFCVCVFVCVCVCVYVCVDHFWCVLIRTKFLWRKNRSFQNCDTARQSNILQMKHWTFFHTNSSVLLETVWMKAKDFCTFVFWTRNLLSSEEVRPKELRVSTAQQLIHSSEIMGVSLDSLHWIGLRPIMIWVHKSIHPFGFSKAK